MKKKMLFLLALCSVTSLALSACAASSGTGNTPPKPENSQESEESLSEDSFVGDSEESVPDTSSEEVESSAEDSSSKEDVESKTDEEIFAEIKAAVLATQNYYGAFSITFREERISSLDGGGYEEGYFTCNPETFELALAGTDEKYIHREKVFEKDGKYYLYYTSGIETELEENQTCDELSLARRAENQANYTDYVAPWTMTRDIGSFVIADTYAELEDAFAIVAADSLSDMKTEGFVNAIGNYAIDLGTEDGKSWITFTTTLAYDENSYGDENSQSQMTYKFVVKNGYVIHAEQNYNAYLGGEWGKEERNEKHVFEYTYAFDKEFYDSIIPCDPQERTEYQLGVRLHVHPNFVRSYYTTITAETKAEDILDGINGYLLRPLPEDLNLEMDAWYLDEACTVKFDPAAITNLLDYEEITDLYAKSITFSSAYACVIEDHQVQKQYSKPYQIMEMFNFGGRGFSGGEPFHLISESYTLPKADKVLVNGVETTAKSLTLEAGKTYVITCIEYAKDGDFWLFS